MPPLANTGLLVGAVNPQTFKDATLDIQFHTPTAPHLNVPAGMTLSCIAH